MPMGQAGLLLVATALFAVWSAGSAAEPAADVAPTPQIVQHGGLELGVTFEGRAVLGEPIFVLVSLRNVDDKPLTLLNLKLSASGLLSRVYTQTCEVSFNEQTIQPKQAASGSCSLTTAGIPAAIYLYRQNRYQMLAGVKIASREDALVMPLDVRLNMPELAVVYGALAGSVLLVLFSSSFAYLRSLPEPPTDVAALKSQATSYLARLPIRVALSAIEIALRAVQGAVVAVILIVLTRTTTEVNAPISIRVDDFWGGLLVGIFSVPLASWLAAKLGAGDGSRTRVAGRHDGPGADPPAHP